MPNKFAHKQQHVHLLIAGLSFRQGKEAIQKTQKDSPSRASGKAAYITVCVPFLTFRMLHASKSLQT